MIQARRYPAAWCDTCDSKDEDLPLKKYVHMLEMIVDRHDPIIKAIFESGVHFELIRNYDCPHYQSKPEYKLLLHICDHHIEEAMLEMIDGDSYEYKWIRIKKFGKRAAT
jgi:hypothetical protein